VRYAACAEGKCLFGGRLSTNACIDQRSGIQETAANDAPKLGLFLNSHSPTVAEQLAHSGYDWLLIDTQHGPMATPTTT
jgi:2-keto-3-deoxy-L-rhamnonate aldolase RhmA